MTSETLSPDQQAYRTQRVSFLVSDARAPLMAFLGKLDDEQLLERLDASLATFDVLLTARTVVSKSLAEATAKLHSARDSGVGTRVLSSLQNRQTALVEETRLACEQLNSAIANTQMYYEVARERGLT